ncbi:oxidoreductase [Pseudomonas aeruginosa]|uniref:Similar to short chain dehydrogenase n=1 Tax=Pseudomonas aeruginosa TaxID=287 RepID=Q8KNA0_PSEAI|nr:oxidoreductase [Pseudomonas aeruginosa]WKW47794.1 flagellin modification protein A [Cloning vector pMA11O12]VTS30600.1 oxidoreductase [Streptococcus dysgalactiae subsp. equisimilis]AAM27594.1 ORF_13; similar to short chain dehydrogenase [Pseudomonas aeruginosa]KRU96509.1 flagellin modification protein A [Pseudomonas aeruginosa]MDK8449066.1 oxidoreductase [Pseudomonas aeruginosa PAO1]
MLNGKRVLISGAGGLLGTRLVERLLSENSIVIAADLDVELLRERLKAIGISEHSSLSLEKLDLNDSEEVMFFFNALPCLDGAVNCAYPRNKQYGRKFFDVELKDFNENLSLHLGASFLFMQQCAKFFEKHKTPFSLVNISSVYGVAAPKFEIYKDTSMTMPVEYAAIKSALIHLSRYAVSFVGDSNFRSNCVSPGGILDSQPSSFLLSYRDECLGKGMLNVEDVLGSIVFLLSDQSKYMNGQNLIIDDGFTL